MFSKKRQKALKSTGASHLAPMHSDESDQRWRYLAHRRNQWAEFCIAMHACALVSIYLLLHFGNRLPFLWLNFTGMLVFVVSGMGSAYVALRCQSHLVAHVQQTLQSRDVDKLSCWIDLLCTSGAQVCDNGQWDQVRAEAKAGLREHLPLLTEETVSLLHTNDRRALYKTLRGQNTELISIVLQIAPLLGDLYALPYVQHLADGKGAARKHPKLQAEAVAVLPQIRAQVALRGSSVGLLRASQPPPTPQGELLLPAHATNETDPAELLRAENRE